jgi:hypothetical protein
MDGVDATSLLPDKVHPATPPAPNGGYEPPEVAPKIALPPATASSANC